ncbi:MAG: hypothetical protein K8S23_09285 [Candidatus Cloacimonetes bacterium]|nr:hypothetical protein [Candidatus Cloacimonadota bacterium]
MNLLRNNFSENISFNKIDFGNILFEKKNLSVVFSTDFVENYELFSYIAFWEVAFENFELYFPKDLFNFFQNLAFSNNIKNFLYDEFDTRKDTILLIFNDEFLKNKKLKHFENSILIDKNSLCNLQFVPNSKTNLDLIYKFSDFMSLPFSKSKLSMKQIEDRSKFFENDNKNVVLDIGKSKHIKYIESLIKILKQHFSANFYLTDSFYEGNAFINVKNIQNNEIFELYILAKNADFFLSDNEEIFNIFDDFDIDQIFLGKSNTFENVKCVHPKNIFEIRSVLEEMMENGE